MFKFDSLLVNSIFWFFISSVSLAQQNNPNHNVDTFPKFQSDEAGFITKTGCKIIPSAYYCLSDGRYYFAVGAKKNFLYLDTAEVLSYQNLDLGKDHRFAQKKGVGFGRRLWLGTVLVGGPIMVALGAGSLTYVAVEVADNLPQGGGGIFIGGLALGTTIFFVVLNSAILNVREHNAYKKAVHYMCL